MYIYMEPMFTIHPTETVIARQARSNIEPDAHLNACARCRAIFDFYRSYFAEEVAARDKPMTEHDCDRVRNILSPGVFQFVPYRTYLNVTTPHITSNPYLLAARDGSDHYSRFQTVASFASDPIKTVIRVLRDTKTGLNSVHVLSDDRLYFCRVEVAVSDQAGHVMHVRTDDDGVGVFDETASIDWKTARLLLLTSQNTTS
jgi:hypothetical protein